jgi:hypothetical protein
VIFEFDALGFQLLLRRSQNPKNFSRIENTTSFMSGGFFETPSPSGGPIENFISLNLWRFENLFEVQRPFTIYKIANLSCGAV